MSDESRDAEPPTDGRRRVMQLRPMSGGAEATALLAGRTLVYPCVSVGNVSQLAVDLLVHTLSAPPIARLRDPSAVPTAGDGSPALVLSTGNEIFSLGEHVVGALPRAPPVAGRAAESARALCDLAASQRVADITLLVSAYAGGRRDVHLSRDASRLRFLVNEAAQERRSELLRGGLKELEGFESGVWTEERAQESEQRHHLGNVQELPSFLPAARSSSFTRTVLQSCKEKEIPLVVILMFVFEGDNTGDAQIMAAAALRALRLVSREESDPKWRQPPSWRYLSGSRAPPSIY